MSNGSATLSLEVLEDGFQRVRTMNDDDEELSDVREQLRRVREMHEDLSAAVAALQDRPMPDQLQIARLKKRKLLLKDQIARLESELSPDLIA